MDYEELFSHYRTLLEARMNLTKSKAYWMRHLLLIASSLLGILVSLHGLPQAGILARYSYLLILLTLSFGILTGGIFAYSELEYQTRAVEAFSKEIEVARQENRKVLPGLAKSLKFFVICEKTAYTCFLCSVMLLALYSIFEFMGK